MAAAQIVPIGYRRRLDERLILALEVMPVAVSWVRLDDGATEFCNNKFVDLFGYTTSELPTVFDLFDLAYADPAIRQGATDHMRGIIGNPLTEQVEFPNMEFDIIAKDGVRKTVLFGGVVIPDGGMALATYLEITAQKERAQLVQRLAEEDPLTGLPNRRVFDRHLNAAMAGLHQDEAVHLLLIDLDGFKLINDTSGHAVGDQILVEVGRRLQAVVRRGDVVARWGGDEFCILAASRDRHRSFQNGRRANVPGKESGGRSSPIRHPAICRCPSGYRRARDVGPDPDIAACRSQGSGAERSAWLFTPVP